MKKIIGAALLGTMAAGTFADVSFAANARILGDAFMYVSPSRKTQDFDENDGEGTDDNGMFTWAKDVKHADEVALNATGDNAGAKIVFNVSSNFYGDNTSGSATKGQGINTDTDGAVALVSYQLWLNFGKIRVDAGAYDQRLTPNLNNDGNWNSTYSATNKVGIWTNIDGAGWGKDSTNITSFNGDKKRTNFQVSSKINDQLTLRGVLFLTKNGTAANHNSSKNTNSAGKEATNDIAGDIKIADDKSRPWIFTPFALGAEYQLSKTNKVAVVGKLAYIAQGGAGANDKPQNSVWTLAADYSGNLSDNIKIEAAYTFGASIYTNNGHDGAHWDGVKKTRTTNHLVRDNDVFAHGFDFRIQDKLSSQLSVTGIVGVNYIQGTAVQRSNNRSPDSSYKDARARSYGTGAAGTLAYYATVSADYSASDTLTYQVQAKLADNNLFSVENGDSSKKHVDYLSGMVLNIRPAILLNAQKNCQLYLGFDFGITGFQTSASGKNNTVQTTYALPVGMRVKL